MNSNTYPISHDSPLCQTIRCLPEKFVVDFANGIDVARDHLRVQRERSGFFGRLYDGCTGQGTRRQIATQECLADGVEASLKWLCGLSESLAHSNLALTRVNDRVSDLTGSVSQLAHFSAETREELRSLAHRLEARMQDMAEEIARIDFVQKAQLNLDASFSKWAAGRFNALSPAARCYVTLEELRWGAVGDYWRGFRARRDCRDFMQIVIDRATQRLADDAKTDVQTVLETHTVWLAVSSTQPTAEMQDLQDAVAYLGDGFTARSEPFSYSAARRPATVPETVPLIARARRIAEGMVNELFPVEVAHD